MRQLTGKAHIIPKGLRARRALAIARVSSDDQEDYSPAAQASRMRDYCIRHGLDVLRAYEITESSTQGDRKEFMRIIDEAAKTARKLREPIAIITDKVDRLQRGFKQQHILEGLREAGLVEYHFCSDHCVIHRESPAKDLFMWNIAVALAQNYTDSLSDNVNRAIRQKLESGEWIGQAPVGYLNFRDNRIKRHGRGKSGVKVDPVRAPLVRQLFEKYATGCYSLSQIVKYAREIGLTNSRGHQRPLIKSHIHKILNDPFYYGVMRYKQTGEEFPHNYPPIIDKELFDQCRDILRGRNRNHTRYGEKNFLFQGILTCFHTGKLCTSEEHIRRYKNGGQQSFIYVASFDPENSRKRHYTRQERVEEAVETALDRLTLANDAELKDILGLIQHDGQRDKYDSQLLLADLWQETRSIDQKLDRLTELRLDGELSADEFIRQKNRLSGRRQEIAHQIARHENDGESFANRLSRLIALSNSARNAYTGSEHNGKRELMSLLFQNLQMDRKNPVITMAKPFELIANCNKTGEWCPLLDAVRQDDALQRSIITLTTVHNRWLVDS